MNGSEWILAKELRKTGEPFIPQARLFGYHPDFYLPRYRTALEVDGPHHLTEEGSRRDSIRDARLRQHGINVVRISCEQVRADTRACVIYALDQARSYAKLNLIIRWIR
jgi:very-short-patch-repair endonuclease